MRRVGSAGCSSTVACAYPLHRGMTCVQRHIVIRRRETAVLLYLVCVFIVSELSAHLESGLKEVDSLPLLVLLNQAEDLPPGEHIHRPPDQRVAHLV